MCTSEKVLPKMRLLHQHHGACIMMEDSIIRHVLGTECMDGIERAGWVKADKKRHHQSIKTFRAAVFDPALKLSHLMPTPAEAGRELGHTASALKTKTNRLFIHSPESF